jgi:fused signal recognition particle receptor
MEEKKGFFKGLLKKFTGGDDESAEISPEQTGETPGSPTPSFPPAAPTVVTTPVPHEEPAEPEEEKKTGLFARFFGGGDDEPEEPAEKKPGFFERLKRGLSKTSESLVGRIDALLLGKKKIDADTLEELEEILITADLGVPATVDLIRTLEQKLKRNELQDGEMLKKALKEELVARLSHERQALDTDRYSPFVILVIGVNGVGKTTTIGKLACNFRAEGKSVILAAGDTFRAAATEQLVIWGKRVGVDVIRGKDGSDPSAVVFDACKAAVARKCDILLVDTAGRLHTKVNLMEELKKIRRIISREIPGAPHETMLILDAATGQNAVNQARIFKEAAEVTGIVLTKLDGTAKGGVVVAIRREFDLPIRYIGIGESVEDLRSFDAGEFVEALF